MQIAMSAVQHNRLIETLRLAWETLDADIIGPLLADDLHYSSWWALIELNSKQAYMTYIKGRFQTYLNSGIRPIVKLGVNKNDGEYAVAIQIGEELPYLIRIIEREGKIKEMWLQPAV